MLVLEGGKWSASPPGK